MTSLLEIQEGADKLSFEDRAGLVAHLLASFPDGPSGPSDKEADERDREMDSGDVAPISHEQFLAEVGRR